MMKKLVLCLYRVGKKNQFQLNDDKIWYFIKKFNKSNPPSIVCVKVFATSHKKNTIKGINRANKQRKNGLHIIAGKKVKLSVYMKIVLTFHCKVATIYHGWIKKDVRIASFLYRYRINVFAEDLYKAKILQSFKKQDGNIICMMRTLTAQRTSSSRTFQFTVRLLYFPLKLKRS